MTDIHTHILPGMDDGAKDADMSLAMLRMERAQGVNAVVLTPHFYRELEAPEHFLKRRRAACQVLVDKVMSLPEAERESLPRMYLGAEVAWMPNLADWPHLNRLCINGGKHLLLELPMTPWNDQMFRQIYDMMDRTGITPVIAHIERYRNTQKKEHIEEILSLGVSVQISAGPLTRLLSRGPELKLLREQKVQYIASDCHDPTTRPPNLGPALKVVREKLGEAKVASMVHRADALLT